MVNQSRLQRAWKSRLPLNSSSTSLGFSGWKVVLKSSLSYKRTSDKHFAHAEFTKNSESELDSELISLKWFRWNPSDDWANWMEIIWAGDVKRCSLNTCEQQCDSRNELALWNSHTMKCTPNDPICQLQMVSHSWYPTYEPHMSLIWVGSSIGERAGKTAKLKSQICVVWTLQWDPPSVNFTMWSSRWTSVWEPQNWTCTYEETFSWNDWANWKFENVRGYFSAELQIQEDAVHGRSSNRHRELAASGTRTIEIRTTEQER